MKKFSVIPVFSSVAAIFYAGDRADLRSKNSGNISCGWTAAARDSVAFRALDALGAFTTRSASALSKH